jgi:DNA gyrase/topoisomerase IV subunit A
MRILMVWLTAILLVTPIICGQSRKDPLNDDEIDEIREYADRPPERLKLYIKFIEERAAGIKELTVDQRAANRDVKIQNLLEQFTRLVDELEDNLDEYDRQHADLRKTLKDLIPTGGKWLEIVNSCPAYDSYDLSRKTAIETAQSLNDSTKDLLTSEEKYFVSHKAEKSYEKKEK